MVKNIDLYSYEGKKVFNSVGINHWEKGIDDKYKNIYWKIIRDILKNIHVYSHEVDLCANLEECYDQIGK